MVSEGMRERVKGIKITFKVMSTEQCIELLHHHSGHLKLR